MSRLKKSQVNSAVKKMIVKVDTREKVTALLEKRISDIQFQTRRATLPVGDYTAVCSTSGGLSVDLTEQVVCERKANLEEVAANFSDRNGNRERFLREFERAKERGIKVYLLIEAEGGWDDIINHRYNSRFTPEALLASICHLQAAYNVNVIFVSPDNSGKLIGAVLRQEMRERLKVIDTPQSKEEGSIVITSFVKSIAQKYGMTEEDLQRYKWYADQNGIDLEGYLDAMDREYQERKSREYLEDIYHEEEENEWIQREEERRIRFRKKYNDWCQYGRGPVDMEDLSCL